MSVKADREGTFDQHNFFRWIHIWHGVQARRKHNKGASGARRQVSVRVYVYLPGIERASNFWEWFGIATAGEPIGIEPGLGMDGHHYY